MLLTNIKFHHYYQAKTSNGFCDNIHEPQLFFSNYLNDLVLRELEKINPEWKYKICKEVLKEYKNER